MTTEASLSHSAFDAIIRQETDNLHLMATQLSKLRLPAPQKLSFSTINLSEQFVEGLLSDVPTGYKKADRGSIFIYLIQAVGSSKNTRKALSGALEVERKKAGATRYCQNNVNESKCVYVGQSKNPRQRFWQHLTGKHPTVYAMHLNQWAAEICLNCSLEYYRFENIDNSTAQAIEDSLWRAMKPMFGKMGAK